MHAKTIQPLSLNKTLTEVLALLKARPEVEAVVTLGTTATGRLTPTSDYDILVVLKNTHQSDFSVEISIIDGRTADILLVSTALVKKLLAADIPSPSSSQLAVVKWLNAGNIIFDHDGIVTQAKANAMEILNMICASTKPMPGQVTPCISRRYASGSYTAFLVCSWVGLPFGACRGRARSRQSSIFKKLSPRS